MAWLARYGTRARLGSGRSRSPGAARTTLREYIAGDFIVLQLSYDLRTHWVR